MVTMAESLEPPVKPQSRPSALSEIRLNAVLAGDAATSSEDEQTLRQEPTLEDARGLVGVSIGREQTRLKSPTTPAAEKAAALAKAGGYFDEGFDGTRADIIDEGGDTEDEERGASFAQGASIANSAEETTTPDEDQGMKSRSSLPSPWRSGPKKFERSEHRSSILRDGFFTRRRSSSGPGSTIDGLQKMFMNSLPSMPKNLSLPFVSSHENNKEGESVTRSKRSSSLFQSSPRFTSAESRALSNQGWSSRKKSIMEQDEEAQATVPELPSAARPALQPMRSRGSYLRRSTSEGSLVTQRTLSRVSSLGDDSRFENVNEQVNSRLKAIRDSWQDSNLRFRGLPSITSSFKPDFLVSRTGSFPSWRPNDGTSSPRQPATFPSPHSKAPIDPMTRQPYHSARDAALDVAPDASKHPEFHRALSRLDGDIVVLGGYRGSILRSAEPPHRQLWVPIKVGLNIRKVDLEVGLEPGDDEHATDKIIPGGMLSHIGPVDISRRLFRRLRASKNAREGKLRVHDYGYDWRLDPKYLSSQLCEFLQSLPCNQKGVPKEKRGALVVAHSLGGLITRHAVNQRPDLFSGVVYAGVPSTCVNILGPLRNGDEVLLSSKVLTAQVNFTIRTSFALLPLDGRCFFDKNTGEEYVVDFFDVKNWLEYRLSPCVARPLPLLHAPPKQSSLLGSVTSMASSLPIPGRKASLRGGKSSALGRSRANSHNVDPLSKVHQLAGAAEPDMAERSNVTATSNQTEQRAQYDATDTLSSSPPEIENDNSDEPPRTAVTIPRERAIAYLERTLASVKDFKQNLVWRADHAAANAYPPASVIYGKSIPTVYGAKVDGREAIKHADAYDDLAFASGDGVVLARAAMLPEGYRPVRRGVVSSERGHVTLLGDLEAIGKCLNAVIGAREKGVGLGKRT